MATIILLCVHWNNIIMKVLAGILQIIGGKMAITPASASFVGPLGLPVEYWSYK